MAFQERSFERFGIRKVVDTAKRQFNWTRFETPASMPGPGSQNAPTLRVAPYNGKAAAFDTNAPFNRLFQAHAKSTGEYASVWSWSEDGDHLDILIEAVSIGSPGSRRWDSDGYRNLKAAPTVSGRMFEEVIARAGLQVDDRSVLKPDGPGRWVATFLKRGTR